jgi:hypothetical protein
MWHLEIALVPTATAVRRALFMPETTRAAAGRKGVLAVVTPDSSEPTGVEAQPAGAQSRVAWVVVVWARVVMGLILGALGGVAFGHAWTNSSAPWWWVGAISLLGGVLLLLSGLYARSRPPGVTPDIVVREAAQSEQELVVPLLGALLIYKYQCLSHRQLDEALQEQRQQGPNRRLIGQILVDRGVITTAQLDTALEHQRTLVQEKLEHDEQRSRPAPPA